MISLEAFFTFTPHELDLCAPCPCGAAPQEECRGQPVGVVHFARRLRRMMAGVRAPCETRVVPAGTGAAGARLVRSTDARVPRPRRRLEKPR